MFLTLIGLLFFPLFVYTLNITNNDSFEFDCAALPYRLNLTNTTILFSNYVIGGTNISLTGVNSTCAQQNRGARSQLVPVDICRVGAYTETSKRSGIHFELWLPRSWSGRFISHGNGGLSGCISYSDLAYSSLNDFAAVSGNSGHNGTSGGSMFHNSDVVADFVHRSVHTGVVVGKEMTKTFYGRPHTKSYYLGCSTGGRQGFKAVQEFPEDFDGVVAGAPAFSFNNLTSWSGNFLKITGAPDTPTFIPASLWNGLIKDDILKQCDHLDGYKDGILEDTSLCHYDPSGLECKGVVSGNNSCLTKAQVNTVKQVYSPLLQPDGSLVYPRMQPGGGYSPMYGGAPFSITQDWYRYVIYENPNWDPTTLSLADMAYAARLNPSNAETWNGDLTAFKARGSKVIHYHGLEDSLISSENSDRYYEHVRQTMHMTPSQLDDFYRYFRISGTGHCGSGPGAWAIGQSGSAVASTAPDANVLTAIVRWVEQGIPPETLMGTKWKGDVAGNGVSFRRRHCRYPQRNHYKSGNASDPESWSCIA